MPQQRTGIVIGVTDAMSVAFLHPLLDALGEEPVTVVCGPRRPDALDAADEPRSREGLDVVRLPWRREVAPLSDARALWRCIVLLRRRRPRVVHAATPKASLLLMLAARITGVPVRVYSVWGLRSESASGPWAAALRLAERLTAWASTVVVCNSESLRRLHRRTFQAGPHPVVPAHGSSHGVDAERFAPTTESGARAAELRASLGIDLDESIVGFVGRLHRDKGIGDLLELSADLPAGTHLVLVGPAEGDAGLIERVSERDRSSQNFHWVGPVEDPSAWFHAFDLLVLPSRREGFPNVVLEAAAAGVPTVGYAATGTVDAVVDGKTGWLVAVGDRDALVAAIRAALAAPARREQAGVAARRRALSDFIPAQVASATVALYGTESNNTRLIVGGQPRWARSLVASIREHSTRDVQTVLRIGDLGRVPRGSTWLWVGYRPGARTLRGRAFSAVAAGLRTWFRPAGWYHYWIGTDVRNATTEAHRHGSPSMPQGIGHVAAAPWLRESLASLDIDAVTVPFPIPLPDPSGPPIAEREPVVLSYVPDRRPDFYGGPALLGLARARPDLQVRIMGGDGSWSTDTPDNVEFLGWVDAAEEYRRARVLVRLVAHDAMGGTVREALAAGLQVVYTYPHPGCRQVAWPVDGDDLLKQVNAALSVAERNAAGITHVAGHLAPGVLVRRLLAALDA